MCLHVCTCLRGKFMSGTTIPPYVHVSNRVQREETLVIKSCCVLKYEGSWAEQKTLRSLTAALQEVQLCWARQTSSKLHRHARLCVCKQKIQICCFPSVLFCQWMNYAYEMMHINQGQSRNIFLSVCVCVVLWLFLFKHMHILARPLTGHGQDGYDHYMSCSSCLLSTFHFFLVCFWQLMLNQKVRILNISPNIRHLLCHQCYNFSFQLKRNSMSSFFF